MTRTFNLLRSIQLFLLFILLFLAAIAYHPVIMQMSRAAKLDSGTVLSRYILAVFIVLFALCFTIRFFQQSRFLRRYAVLLVIVGVVALSIYAFISKTTMITETRTLFISLAAIIIGWKLDLSDKELRSVVFVFGLVTLFSGVMQVMINIGGFRVADYYLTDSKNSLGAMLATGAISFLYIYLTPSGKLTHLVSLACFLLSVFVIVTIRARASIVAVFALSLLAYYLKTRNRNVVLVVMGTFVILGLSLVIMPSTVIQYFTDSMTAGSQGDDITSGRVADYIEAISYLSNHLLFGNVLEEYHMGWIHNYPLLQLFRYGIVLSFPILSMYVYLGFFCIKKSFQIGVDSFIPGFIVMLAPGLISLVEPTFPFGPGTVTIVNFILLGAALRKVRA